MFKCVERYIVSVSFSIIRMNPNKLKIKKQKIKIKKTHQNKILLLILLSFVFWTQTDEVVEYVKNEVNVTDVKFHDQNSQ